MPSAAAAPDNLTTGTRTSRTSGVVTAPSLRDLSGALSLLPPVSALPLPPLPPLLPQHVEIPASVARDGRAFVWHPQPTGVGLPSGSPVFPASPELVPRDRAARAAARGERAANRTGAASCPRPWDLLLRAHIDRKSSSMASAEVAVAESDNKGGGRGGAGHGRGRHSGVETAPARTSPRRRAGSLSPEGRAGHEGASAGHARVMGMEVPDVEVTPLNAGTLATVCDARFSGAQRTSVATRRSGSVADEHPPTAATESPKLALPPAGTDGH